MSDSTVNLDDVPYNYIPTRWVAIVFVSLYGASAVTHLVQALFFRMWWILPTIVLAGIVEVIGWSGRLWSSFSPTLIKPFQMQITGTILAPTPLIAGNFIILGDVIRQLGPVYSRLNPRWYSILFCSLDIVSLVIQGVGGGMASTAAQDNKDPTPGGNVMLGGIVFQLFAIALYAICATEFFVRYLKDRPLQSKLPKPGDSTVDSVEKVSYFRGALTVKLKIMISGLSFSTLCLFVRAIYRVIELSDGWSGRIISTQVYFNVLDGAMVTLAIYTLNLAHPGLLLGSARQRKEKIEVRNANNATSSTSTVV